MLIQNGNKVFHWKTDIVYEYVQQFCGKRLADEYIDVIKKQSKFTIKRNDYVNVEIDRKFNDYTFFTYWMYIRDHHSIKRNK